MASCTGTVCRLGLTSILTPVSSHFINGGLVPKTENIELSFFKLTFIHQNCHFQKAEVLKYIQQAFHV